MVEALFRKAEVVQENNERPRHRSSLDSLDSLVKIYITLTNFKIRSQPLFAEDGSIDRSSSQSMSIWDDTPSRDAGIPCAMCQVTHSSHLTKTLRSTHKESRESRESL